MKLKITNEYDFSYPRMKSKLIAEEAGFGKNFISFAYVPLSGDGSICAKDVKVIPIVKINIQMSFFN